MKPDEHAIVAASRLLDLPPEYIDTVTARYYSGGANEFALTYTDASRLLGLPESTLRARVARGYYAEGIDYKRTGKRTVRFSRWIGGNND